VAAVFAAIAVAFYFIRGAWRFLRRLFSTPEKNGLQRAIELFHRMVVSYDELKGGIATSPRRVREVLVKVADEGASWDPSVFSILDAAIVRSSGSWMIAK
jgi:hypothetical protein